ncbi:MAG: methyl-accepting chemotaxis protein [Lachnospiraceae bacterium]|nr:methyl-accepting chemotaxis protein [Lachnospiraceae bacterium]
MKNLSIKVKLLMATLPILIVLIHCVTYMSIQMRQVGADSEELYYNNLYKINSLLIEADRDYYQAMLAATVYRDVTNGSTNLGGAADMTDQILSEKSADFEENKAQVTEKVNEAVAIAEKNPKLYSEIVDENGNTFETYVGDFTTEFDAWSKEYDVTSGQGDWLTFNEEFVNARDSLDGMQIITETWAEEERATNNEEIDATIKKCALIYDFIALCLIILLVIIIRQINNGIKEVTRDLKKLAENDLSAELPQNYGKDEIGQMKKAFADMQTNLTNVVTTLKTTTGGLNDVCEVMNEDTSSANMSMQGITSASGEIANTATSQAQDVSDIAANMTDLSDLMNTSVEIAEKLAKVSREIDGITKEGNKKVTELTDINNMSLSAFNSIFGAIDNIQESSNKISEASELISSIASQTNLLSLNASIEAARAGENGKGFAVVADEIRKLSDESEQNVQTINEILAELQIATKGAIEKSNAVKGYVDKQNQSVEDTKVSFDSIVGSIDHVNSSINEIENINDELDKKIKVISESVSNLAAISEENAATAQELAATSDTVTGNVTGLMDTQTKIDTSAEEIAEIINKFKLKEN